MITRENAKELLPIIKAYAEGKIIEVKNFKGEWIECDEPYFDSSPGNYRIKSEPKYRPFKSIKECLTEMLRHSDIGYVRYKCNGKKELIKVGAVSGIDYNYGHGEGWCGYTLAFEMFTFTDGEPFGIKEE